MTRKEKEIKMLKALGLKVGDVITIKSSGKVFDIEDKELDRLKLCQGGELYEYSVWHLLTDDFEKVSPNNAIGNERCCDTDCDNCPLNGLNCNYVADSGMTLFETWEKIKEKYPNSKLWDELVMNELNKE